MNRLYPFQEQAVKLMSHRKHTLLGDHMGLGKTIQGIALFDSLKLRRILIICKATIKVNWQRKIEDWQSYPYSIQIVNTKTDNIEPWAEIVIINYDIISHSYMFNQLIHIPWQLIICDEAHYLKNMKAIRTRTVLGKNGLVHHTERTLMMTGTPVLNRPVELYPILKVLSPETIYPYKDYFSYAKRYCDAWWDKFSFNDKGASHTAELNERLRSGYMIRRTYAEVEMQLPKRRYEIILIDQSDGVKANLQILENAERKDFKRQTLGVDAGGLATLRRETAEAKIDATIEKIHEYVESVDKIVIFAYHHSVIEKLHKELQEYRVVTITGNTPTKFRQLLIDDFINDKAKKVFLGQIQAAGEGIDSLQRVCHNVLFVEWSWSPAEINQAIARVWRLGQEHPVLVRFLVWANSIESHMLRTVLDKAVIIKEIMK